MVRSPPAKRPEHAHLERLGLRLFTAHFTLHQAASALAGAFIGAYLLRSGLTLPAALMVYAGLYAGRVGMRVAVLPLVRRLGYRGALAAGAALGVLQFPPLLLADNHLWLAVWVATLSLAEATYWPVFHATAVVLGEEGKRGREIAGRQVIGLGVSVVGPLLGGWLLGTFGPAVDFGVAASLAVLSTVPLALLREVQAGPVPTARESLRGADPIGTLAFAADGWICAGLGIAWPMVLFQSLGAHYEALGAVAAASAVVGAAGGVLCGRCIDRGGRERIVPWAALALAANAPFLSLYLPKAAETGMHPWEVALGHAPTPLDVLNVGEANLLFGWLVRALNGAFRPGFPFWSELMTGLTPALLLVFAALWHRERRWSRGRYQHVRSM